MSTGEWKTSNEWREFIDAVLTPQDRDELIAEAHGDVAKTQRRATRSDAGIRRGK